MAHDSVAPARHTRLDLAALVKRLLHRVVVPSPHQLRQKRKRERGSPGSHAQHRRTLYAMRYVCRAQPSSSSDSTVGLPSAAASCASYGDGHATPGRTSYLEHRATTVSVMQHSTRRVLRGHACARACTRTSCRSGTCWGTCAAPPSSSTGGTGTCTDDTTCQQRDRHQHCRALAQVRRTPHSPVDDHAVMTLVQLLHLAPLQHVKHLSCP